MISRLTEETYRGSKPHLSYEYHFFNNILKKGSRLDLNYKCHSTKKALTKDQDRILNTVSAEKHELRIKTGSELRLFVP